VVRRELRRVLPRREEVPEPRRLDDERLEREAERRLRTGSFLRVVFAMASNFSWSID
jgi:hypothetical protein